MVATTGQQPKKYKKEKKIQGVGGLKRCNPLSEKPILSPKYREYRRLLTYEFSDESEKSIHAEYTKILSEKPQGTRS